MNLLAVQKSGKWLFNIQFQKLPGERPIIPHLLMLWV